MRKFLATAAIIAATITAAHAGQYKVGQEVRFHTPTPACRDQSAAQFVAHHVIRLAAENNIGSMEELARSHLWHQVEDFVYSREGCVLLESGEWFKIVRAPVTNASVDYCLITANPLDVRSPEEVAKETPEAKAAAEKQYCHWTGMPNGGRW